MTSTALIMEPATQPRADLANVFGRHAPLGAPEHIRDSWRRSAEWGLRPDRLDVPFVADVDTDGPLVQAAGAVLDQLAADLAGARVAVVLSNERGQVVDRRLSEPSLYAALDSVLLAPGYVYTEAAVGTNGIGTALAAREPVAVIGEEHFADALTEMACAGAPITDLETGRIAGVIDLSCRAAEASPLMLAMASSAAREIARRLLEGSGVAERLALQRFLQERRGAKGPLVLITDRSMLTNAAANRLVDPGDEDALRQSARKLMCDRLKESELVLSRGAAVALRSEAIVDGGRPVGAILRLRPVGGATDPRRAFGWEGLTDTERSVTELVAHGLTNREVAQRLFLSHHTVGFHLRSIFRKLDVSSRVDLARLVAERREAPA